MKAVRSQRLTRPKHTNSWSPQSLLSREDEAGVRLVDQGDSDCAGVVLAQRAAKRLVVADSRAIGLQAAGAPATSAADRADVELLEVEKSMVLSTKVCARDGVDSQ